MKILAVDYGDSRTGLATCDPTEFLTTPITPQITLKARQQGSRARSAAWPRRQKAELIVVGLPLNMDGTEGERAKEPQAGKDFADLERPAGADVGRAADHLRSRRHPGRGGDFWCPPQGHSGFRQRHGHSGRLPRLAQGAPRRNLNRKQKETLFSASFSFIWVVSR